MTDQLLAGRYRLEDEIGAGGMGRVWRASDVRLDREVAVKTVDLSGVSDPSLAGRFQREIVLTARLTSPYTVTVFDGGLDGRTAYLVMELLKGESLAEAIARGGPLGVGRAVEVAREVTLGLAAAHAVGLVHRDIKPANVMLTVGGRVKLLDFGIAQLTGQADPHLTQTSMTIGTAAYMSPEQAAGLRVDAATDLYALGCLIMTMLTGRPPFDGDQPVVVASHQINSAPPRLAQRRPDVPPALDALVARLLAKNPLERPDTAATLRALEYLQADPAAPTAPVPTPSVPAPAPPPGAQATRPYTQPLQPEAQRALAGLPAQPGSWWIAGVLVSLMAAIVVAGVSANLTGVALTNLGKAFPASTASAKSSTAKPSTSKPTRTPSKTKTTTPDPGTTVALAAALQGVRLALSSLPDSTAKTDLLERWDATSASITAGSNRKQALAAFESAVKASKLAGWEQQAVLAATGLVKSQL
ncbi:serine/threonine-protein kinase [Micropruina sp.]|uniref:serine/threonine-protein kinase n=1 Tax=Micropruina sp. TaxID=2737536 RepID=UPI0039E3DC6B